jgi:fused signal recognition particle receptor
MQSMFSFIKKKLGWGANPAEPAPSPEAASPAAAVTPAAPSAPTPLSPQLAPPTSAPAAASVEASSTPAQVSGVLPASRPHSPATAATAAAAAPAQDQAAPAERRSWLDKLRNGLRKTGSSIAQVFTGTQIDDALYEELESALLMADAGVAATEHLLADLKRRVKEAKATDPSEVKGLLVEAITELLLPLEKPLEVGHHTPTVIMVAGVNGAGKTTTIGKLTRHLAGAGQKVLLAAADTFRAAAREQLLVWADRNHVDIVSQEGGDPAAVTFDAVQAGKARGCDVVIADTAGRLATQLHLMEELRKIKRVIAKAMDSAPHEVLLVVDGNTGQNALAQVKAFDEALGLTGLVVTKLDGTAKGGVLAAIALWSRGRHAPVPVYFIGVGEKLEDLQTFSAREFAQALLS